MAHRFRAKMGQGYHLAMESSGIPQWTVESSMAIDDR